MKGIYNNEAELVIVCGTSNGITTFAFDTISDFILAWCEKDYMNVPELGDRFLCAIYNGIVYCGFETVGGFYNLIPELYKTVNGICS